jgi:hypothetical protein
VGRDACRPWRHILWRLDSVFCVALIWRGQYVCRIHHKSPDVPLIIFTLGLFIFVINGLMLWLTSAVSGALGLGFRVEGFWPAFWGALVVSLVSTALSWMMRPPRVIVHLER